MNYIYPIETKVSIAQREKLLNQRPTLIWFTGLSGSGKSTIAVQLEAALHAKGFKTYLLDGDNIRSGLNKDLTFTEEDRVENIRRIGEVAKLFSEANVVAMTAFISPYRADRDLARKLVPPGQFFEIFCQASVEDCEKRDPKGLYKKARAGEIPEFTGISAPYEAPEKPELILETAKETLEESTRRVLSLLQEKNII